MSELNPQIRVDLKTIAVSPPLLPTVICVRPDYRPVYKEALVDALRELHVDPKGQQILTLFKVDRLVPFDDSYLESARQVLARHEKLVDQMRRNPQQTGGPVARRSMEH